MKSASTRRPRFVRPRWTRPVDRAGEREVLAAVDRDAGDGVVADRAGASRRAARRRSRRAARRPRLAARDRRRSSPDGLRQPSSSATLGGLVVEPSSGPIPSSSSARRSARRASSRSIPFLMLWSVLTTSPSSPTRTLTAYSSAPRRTSSASASASPMIRRLSASACWVRPRSSIRKAACSCALADDPLGLFLGLLDDPLALGVDPLRGADLLGHGDAQLVDQAEGGRLVDDDVVRQGQLLAVGDDRLEALDEEDDVDRSALRGVDRAWWRAGSRARSDAGPDYRTARRAPSALRSRRCGAAHSTMSIVRSRRSAMSRNRIPHADDDGGDADHRHRDRPGAAGPRSARGPAPRVSRPSLRGQRRMRSSTRNACGTPDRSSVGAKIGRWATNSSMNEPSRMIRSRGSAPERSRTVRRDREHDHDERRQDLRPEPGHRGRSVDRSGVLAPRSAPTSARTAPRSVREDERGRRTARRSGPGG